jgi:hypothetical protein
VPAGSCPTANTDKKKLPQYNTEHKNVFNAEQNALIVISFRGYFPLPILENR